MVSVNVLKAGQAHHALTFKIVPASHLALVMVFAIISSRFPFLLYHVIQQWVMLNCDDQMSL